MRDSLVEKVHRADVDSAEGIADGQYAGTISGYCVRFSTEYGDYQGTVRRGIRGLNIPCTVVVRLGVFNYFTQQESGS